MIRRSIVVRMLTAEQHAYRQLAKWPALIESTTYRVADAIGDRVVTNFVSRSCLLLSGQTPRARARLRYDSSSLYFRPEFGTLPAVLHAVPHAHDRWDLFAVVTLLVLMLTALGISYLAGFV